MRQVLGLYHSRHVGRQFLVDHLHPAGDPVRGPQDDQVFLQFLVVDQLQGLLWLRGDTEAVNELLQVGFVMQEEGLDRLEKIVLEVGADTAPFLPQLTHRVDEDALMGVARSLFRMGEEHLLQLVQVGFALLFEPLLHVMAKGPCQLLQLVTGQHGFVGFRHDGSVNTLEWRRLRNCAKISQEEV